MQILRVQSLALDRRQIFRCISEPIPKPAVGLIVRHLPGHPGQQAIRMRQAFRSVNGTKNRTLEGTHSGTQGDKYDSVSRAVVALFKKRSRTVLIFVAAAISAPIDPNQHRCLLPGILSCTKDWLWHQDVKKETFLCLCGVC